MVKRAPALRRVSLAELTIDGERELRELEVYAALKARLLRDRYVFRVPPAGAPALDWNRALLLNLTFWTPDEGADVLVAARIPADVVAHVGWHHVASRALGKAAATADGLLLGEAIASAFDLYLVGRLLARAPESTFLRSQVPAMAEVAASAGTSARDFARLLAGIAAEPEGAFAELRALLFSVSIRLLRARGTRAAVAVLEGVRAHRFHPILHHYNLSTWVLYARAHGATPRSTHRDAVARADRALRRAPRALAWLMRAWL